MTLAWLVGCLGVGIPLLVVTILWIVFSTVARAVARVRVAIESEGVELDSGQVWIKTRYRSFRAPGIYASRGTSLHRGYLVLTRERLAILKVPQHYGSIPRACLGAFTVGTEDGKLRLHSDEPPNATGTVDFVIPVRDPAAWIEALTQAGARRMSDSHK